jgi:uncharacterized protein YecE (DUF72 family)
MQKRSVRIGCSGWQYPHWKGDFYPTLLPQKKWLDYYAAQFDTVEINNSFYRLPSEKTFSEWRDRVPAPFLYALKASRYLTHIRRLKDPADPLRLFWSRARLLGSKLGPVLYQLPPHWKRNERRFFDFLEALPEEPLQVVEFRDPSWYTDAIFRRMEAKKVAMCIHDHHESVTPREIIGPFVYARFHGSEGHYQGAYSDHTLQDWAAWFAKEARSGKTIYAYFNNDAGAHAPRNARTLRASLTALLQKEAA